MIAGTTKSWILHGPQGSGKTKHADAIAKALGVTKIKDEWNGRLVTFSELDTLHICDELPLWANKNRRVLTMTEAMNLLKEKAS